MANKQVIPKPLQEDIFDTYIPLKGGGHVDALLKSRGKNLGSYRVKQMEGGDALAKPKPPPKAPKPKKEPAKPVKAPPESAPLSSGQPPKDSTPPAPTLPPSKLGSRRGDEQGSTPVPQDPGEVNVAEAIRKGHVKRGVVPAYYTNTAAVLEQGDAASLDEVWDAAVEYGPARYVYIPGKSSLLGALGNLMARKINEEMETFSRAGKDDPDLTRIEVQRLYDAISALSNLSPAGYRQLSIPRLRKLDEIMRGLPTTNAGGKGLARYRTKQMEDATPEKPKNPPKPVEPPKQEAPQLAPAIKPSVSPPSLPPSKLRPSEPPRPMPTEKERIDALDRAATEALALEGERLPEEKPPPVLFEGERLPEEKPPPVLFEDALANLKEIWDFAEGGSWESNDLDMENVGNAIDALQALKNVPGGEEYFNDHIPEGGLKLSGYLTDLKQFLEEMLEAEKDEDEFEEDAQEVYDTLKIVTTREDLTLDDIDEANEALHSLDGEAERHLEKMLGVSVGEYGLFLDDLRYDISKRMREDLEPEEDEEDEEELEPEEEEEEETKETSPLPPIPPQVKQIVDGVGKVDDDWWEEVVERVRRWSGNDSISPEDIKRRLRQALDDAELTINFDPGMPLPSGETLKQVLANARRPRLKNLYEVGTGNGETHTPTRLGWEQRNFGDAVEDLPHPQRPKYGAVNWGNRESGATTTYGSGVFIINKDAFQDRLTLAASNTSETRSHQVGNYENPWPAMGANWQALQEAGLVPRDASYWTTVLPGERRHAYQQYTEAQFWGELPINATTIKEIRFPERLRGKVDEVEELGKRLGIPVKFFAR